MFCHHCVHGWYATKGFLTLTPLPPRPPAPALPLCNTKGEIAACLVRVPTENVKQKMQAGLYKATGDCVRGILKEQGVGGFYVGYMTTVCDDKCFVFWVLGFGFWV